MKIIDVERKGNLVRFFLSTNENYSGENWNASYGKAGTVHQYYVEETKDLVFPFSAKILEPKDVSDDYYPTVSKKSLKNREYPCLIVLPKKKYNHRYFNEFLGYAEDRVLKIYYNDDMDTLLRKIDQCFPELKYVEI